MDLTAICGDNCFYCPRYIATKSGHVEELEIVKELWVRLGLRNPDFSVEAMECNGCKSENKCAYTDLRTCVHKKGIANCGFCNEYPCMLINTVFNQSEKLRSLAGSVCTKEEIDMLHKAFFSKKEYFDRIHLKHKEQ